MFDVVSYRAPENNQNTHFIGDVGMRDPLCVTKRTGRKLLLVETMEKNEVWAVVSVTNAFY